MIIKAQPRSRFRGFTANFGAQEKRKMHAFWIIREVYKSGS